MANDVLCAAKRLERSLDTMQRLYAVVAALAIGEAIKRAFLNQTGHLDITVQKAFLLIAFLVTVIPFVHGMNRHLDDHLHIAGMLRNERLLKEMLFIDLPIFFVESSLLFLIAVLVDAGPMSIDLLLGTTSRNEPAIIPPFLIALTILFVVDITWCHLHSGEHYESPIIDVPVSATDHWAGVNHFASLALIVLLVGLSIPLERPAFRALGLNAVALIIAAVAVLRTAWEYMSKTRGLKFYFHLPRV
jgi:hypothetical protein